MRFGFHHRAPNQAGRWLALLCLLIGVLVPTACVLWFMNDAVDSQKQLAKRQLDQARAAELSAQTKLFLERSNTWWKELVAKLERQTDGRSPSAAFELAIRSGLADSVIVLARDGSAAYPLPAALPAADPLEHRADWLEARRLESRADSQPAAADAYGRIAAAEQNRDSAARAYQAQIRCLVRSGRPQEAARIATREFSGGRLLRAADPQGRFIAADELLLALQLSPASSYVGKGAAVGQDAAGALRTILADYTNGLPSSQRLFLMSELHSRFPTYEAEVLAAHYLDADSPHRDADSLHATALPDVWRIASFSGRVVALFRTATVQAATRSQIAGSGIEAALPTRPWTDIVGAPPNWRITIPRLDSDSGTTASRRTVAYLWIGFLAISVLAVASLIAGQGLRRQWQLARVKTDLVAAVSHELKTPVSSVRALVETLLEDEKADARKTREYFELIARESLRLSRVIETFLTFARLERNRQEFEFTSRRPDALVDAALDAAHERLRDCLIDVEVATGLPFVRADEEALVTVLLNLIDNAWKYTPADKHIAVRVYRADARVVFEVADNGIGIAARDHKKIFRRFYQVDRRLSRDSGGCGLGLSIVDFIVRAHGGSVRVQSQPGRGSTFSVSIPEAA
jgi:signal transduction histidine kinase